MFWTRKVIFMDNMKNDYVKKIQKTQEAKSLLKHAYTIMQENLTETHTVKLQIMTRLI